MKENVFRALRWLAVLPCAYIYGLLGHLIALFFQFEIPRYVEWEILRFPLYVLVPPITQILIQCGSVAAFNIAPSHKHIAATCLAVLVASHQAFALFYYAPAGMGGWIIALQAISWILGAVCAIVFCVGVWDAEVPKEPSFLAVRNR